MFSAILIEKDATGQSATLTSLEDEQLPAGNVSVDVEYSTLNYKDGLAIHGKSPVVRRFPMVPGIDLAGTVTASEHPAWKAGDRVVLNGWGVGEGHWGGLAQRARINGDWLIALPAGLTARQTMAIGTAGYTASLCVDALLAHGVSPDQGEVLVTGATGGVGSMAVAMLAGLGFTVAASTGKPEAAPFLRGLGASEIIDREELADVGKPLQSVRWASAVDAVGGATLAHVLATLAPGGVVAASGNVGGADLPTTVLPFILRGVTLFGIDSAGTPIDRRREVWARIATDLKPAGLDAMGQVVDLAHVESALDEIGRGGVTGRYVVQL
jgi:acrylyl-CoA reductase (NADPH)